MRIPTFAFALMFSASAMALPIAPVIAGGALLGISIFSSGRNNKKEWESEVCDLELDISTLENTVELLEYSANECDEDYSYLEKDYLFLETDLTLETDLRKVHALSMKISPYCDGTAPSSVSQAVRDEIALHMRSRVINQILYQSESYLLVNEVFKASFPDSEYHGNIVKLRMNGYTGPDIKDCITIEFESIDSIL